jgi:hypothetical protein
MNWARFILLVGLMFCAQPALAAVSINEVAWMGGVDSANYEWIELYNSGDSAVVVDGWTLKDGMNFNLNLLGTIGSNSYAVLERTSEESALGTAFFIYTGALVNTGATLVLSDSGGAIIDQVTGGTDWENIGGDNTTKETAQYSTSGWVTDVGTPGSSNGAGRVEEEIIEEEVVNNSNSSSGSSKKSSAASVRLINSETKMTLKTDVQSIAYVNQLVTFKASASGLAASASKLVRFQWNFGDSYIATTTTAWHSYKYPGTYVVTVYARSGKSEQVSRHEITVLPVVFSLTRNEEGDIQINNDSPYDVDASGYTLRGEKSITLPPRTIIANRGTVTIEAARLDGEVESDITFYDNKQTKLASTDKADYYPEEVAFADEAIIFSPSTKVLGFTNSPSTIKNEDSNFNFLGNVVEASEVVGEEGQANFVALTTATETIPIAPQEKPKWPYLALIGLLLSATLGVVASKK